MQASCLQEKSLWDQAGHLTPLFPFFSSRGHLNLSAVPVDVFYMGMLSLKTLWKLQLQNSVACVLARAWWFGWFCQVGSAKRFC